MKPYTVVVRTPEWLAYNPNLKYDELGAIREYARSCGIEFDEDESGIDHGMIGIVVKDVSEKVILESFIGDFREKFLDDAYLYGADPVSGMGR